MSEEEKKEKLYQYLELNDSVDYRLRLKAELMKKTISYVIKWKEGTKEEWINKLATRCSLSTRKMRENYIEPLITEGILKHDGDGRIRFVGIPENAEMPCELSDEQLKEELEEENAQRIQLGKTPISMETWKKTRSKRVKPLTK